MSTGFTTLPSAPPTAWQRYGGWRRFRSMRTAIYLLLTLAAANVVGSLIPQVDNGGLPRVEQFRAEYPFLARVADFLGLFELFGSWWFLTLYGLLVTVLVACLLPRTRAWVRAWRSHRTPPRSGRFPATPLLEEWRTEVPRGAAQEAGRRAMRRRHYRVGPANEAGQQVAERGWTREAGSLLFHWSFFLLFVAAAAGKGLGFTGAALVVEGETWTETELGIDDYDPGFLHGMLGGLLGQEHKAFQLRLDEFTVSYLAGDDVGEFFPDDFRSDVTVLEDGQTRRTWAIEVNNKLAYDGVKFFQASFGFAPDLTVVVDGETVWDGPAPMLARGEFGEHTRDLRLPTLEPDVGLQLTLYPDFFQAPEEAQAAGMPPFVSVSPMANRPILIFSVLEGDLGAQRSVYRIEDPQGMAFAGAGFVTLDDAVTVSDGEHVVEVAFNALPEYSIFQVARDPGVPLAFLGGALVLVGLIPSLVVARRRVWLAFVEEAESGLTVVRVGGIAYHRKDDFPAEWEHITRTLRAVTPPVLVGTSPGNVPSEP